MRLASEAHQEGRDVCFVSPSEALLRSLPARSAVGQVLIDVGIRCRGGGFNRGRVLDPETRALLVQSFDLQVECEISFVA